MDKEDYEKEMQNLYRMALKQENAEVCMYILAQLQSLGFSLPPLEIPEHLLKEKVNPVKRNKVRYPATEFHESLSNDK